MQTIRLPKQRNSSQSSWIQFCFLSLTAWPASYHNFFCTMWLDPAKSLLFWLWCWNVPSRNTDPAQLNPGQLDERPWERGCNYESTEDFEFKNPEQSQAAQMQAPFMNHTRNTIWRRIIRVCMGFSTRYPWRSLKVKMFNKNGLPYSIRVLFSPGVVILPI